MTVRDNYLLVATFTALFFITDTSLHSQFSLIPSADRISRVSSNIALRTMYLIA